jgi:hypothetical protein
MNANEIIEHLGLQPHPEGGYYRETWRGESLRGRACGTAIYFLLKRGERSRWHRVDATEIWHFYAGAPLRLGIAKDDESDPIWQVLGPDLQSGEKPQIEVCPNAWQAAESTGEFTLVGCTVSPGFQFSGFTMAEPGFEPGA